MRRRFGRRGVAHFIPAIRTVARCSMGFVEFLREKATGIALLTPQLVNALGFFPSAPTDLDFHWRASSFLAKARASSYSPRSKSS